MPTIQLIFASLPSMPVLKNALSSSAYAQRSLKRSSVAQSLLIQRMVPLGTSGIGFAFDAHGSAWGLVAMGGEFSSPTL